jgi:hypothetical protein
MQIALDIEVLPNYFLITMLDMDKGSFMEAQLWNGRGKSAIQKALKFLTKLKPTDMVYTYNGISYDLPVIKRVMEEGVPDEARIFEISQEVINSEGFEHRVKQFANETHIDLMELLNLNRAGNRVSLKKAAAILGFPKLLDMPKHWSEPVEKGESKMMKEYCRIDCEATAFIAQYGKGEIADRKALIEDVYPGLAGKGLVTMGRPRVAKKVLTWLYQNETGENPYKLKEKYWGSDRDRLYAKLSRMTFKFKDIIPDIYNFNTYEGDKLFRELRSFERKGWYGTAKDTKERMFNREVEICGKPYQVAEGGLHDNFGPGIYESDGKFIILNIDAASYYPYLKSKVLKIDPRHLPGLHKVEDGIIDYRLKHKALRYKFEKSNRIQKSQKIVINAGIFGLLGDEYSPTFDPMAKLGVTMNGQLMLLQLVEWLSHTIGGIEVIQANTDGIGVICPRGEKYERLKKACAYWEQCFKIELEIDELKKFVKRNANSYLEVGMDGEIIKGAKEFNDEINPGKSRQFPVITKCLREYYAYGREPKEVLAEEKNIHEYLTVVSCRSSDQNYFKIDGSGFGKMQKTVRFYRAVNGGYLGRMVANGTNVNKFPHADSVRVALDIPDPDVKNYPDLDYAWYEARAWEEIKQVS